MKVRIDFDIWVVSLNATGGHMGAVTAAGQTMYWFAYKYPELVHEWIFEFYHEEDNRNIDINFPLEISDKGLEAANQIAALIAAGPKKACGHRCDAHGER